MATAHIVSSSAIGIIERLLITYGANSLDYDVRFVITEMTNKEAQNLEIALIAEWRSLGMRLANATSGGDGLHDPSDETRERLAKAAVRVHKGRIHSEEEKVRRAASVKLAMQRPETKQKKSVAMRALWANTDKRAKMIVAMREKSHLYFEARSRAQRGNKKALGHKHTSETHLLMSQVQKERAKQNPITEETRIRMSAGQKRRFAREKANKETATCSA